FVSVSPALQRRRATLAAHGADETIRPAPPQQKRRAGRFVGKFRLELSKRPRPRHRNILTSYAELGIEYYKEAIAKLQAAEEKLGDPEISVIISVTVHLPWVRQVPGGSLAVRLSGHTR